MGGGGAQHTDCRPHYFVLFLGKRGQGAGATWRVSNGNPNCRGQLLNCIKGPHLTSVIFVINSTLLIIPIIMVHAKDKRPNATLKKKKEKKDVVGESQIRKGKNS